MAASRALLLTAKDKLEMETLMLHQGTLITVPCIHLDGILRILTLHILGEVPLELEKEPEINRPKFHKSEEVYGEVNMIVKRQVRD